MEDRKAWLQAMDPDICMDYDIDDMTYKEFIDKELILFSQGDNVRSIPRGEVLKTAVASCGLRLFHEVSWRPLSSEQRRRASLVGRSVCAHERGFEHAMLSGGVVHCQVMGARHCQAVSFINNIQPGHWFKIEG